MDEDGFDVDADLLAALATTVKPFPDQPQDTKRIQHSKPHRITQPTHQRADEVSGSSRPSRSSSAIVQPTPQILPNRSSGSSIQVSSRQKGNPVLACIKNLPWEYSDIPADYVMGMKTCALFLSLKYHRLHPEYIYKRIQSLKGKYTLRIVLTMVDITNHEDCLKELSKTSLVNGVTLMLCWSAQEAARYLELYKSLEHAGPAAIKGRPPASYSERVVEFVTVPRGVNKVDAVTLVSGFGTLRNAVNADPEAIVGIPGWGQRKVRRWMDAVEEPFSANKTPRQLAQSSDAVPLGGTVGKGENLPAPGDNEDAVLKTVLEQSRRAAEENAEHNGPPATDANVLSGSVSASTEQLSDGVVAALARLRQKG